MDLQSTRLTEENSWDLSVFLSFYNHAVMFSTTTKLLIRFLFFHFIAEEIKKATKTARLRWKNDKGKKGRNRGNN